MLPWIFNRKFLSLRNILEDLLNTVQKYLCFLQKQNDRTKEKHESKEPIRSLTDNWCFRIIESVPNPSNGYSSLISRMNTIPVYTPFDLIDFEPADRFDRRTWIQELKLPFAVGLFTYCHGNYLGNVNIIWKQPEKLERESTSDISIINDIKAKIPKFGTRAMFKEFHEKYAKSCKEKPAILRSLYQYLTGYTLTSTNKAEEAIDARVSKFFLNSDDPKLLLDLRHLNGRVKDPKYNPFWEEMQKFLDEKSVVHERRHNEIAYMPFAISVRDLREQILSRLPPDSAAPTTSWIRLNFFPANGFINSAAQYTGKFKVKHAVQQRLLRVHHEDADFAYYQYLLLKTFAVKWRDHCLMQCMDDKAIVPVGEPHKPTPAVSRAHHRGLVNTNSANLTTDHDYHICGIVPSVCLFVDIPDNSRGSFYHGDVHITLKDKIFQPSTPFRHAAETVKIVRSYFSEDDVNANKPIIVRYTDGGPDHRPTFASVQLASILEFIALDLDMVIACRCAPHQSYNNPAERMMSLLNLGLQNVSLTRKEMEIGHEMKMKSMSTMSAVRKNKNEVLISALKESINAPIQIVKDVFSRLKRTHGDVYAHDACSEDEITGILNIAQIVSEDLNAENVKKLKDLTKVPELKNFVERHCRKRQYSFQVLSKVIYTFQTLKE